MLSPVHVAMLPCLLIVFLWFALPAPKMPSQPVVNLGTREAAMRALESVHQSQRNIIQSKITSRIRGRYKSSEYFNEEYASSDCAPAIPKRNVLLITAISPQVCKTNEGDRMILLSIKNKQDYARIHGFQSFFSVNQTDENLKGAWNKVALIRRILLTRSDYEWVIWMDYDALIVNMKFEIPFERYSGHDLVMWGQPKELYTDGDAHMGLNTGVLLVRNTKWSRDFFGEVAKLGFGNGKLHEKLMMKKLGVYNWALFDQNGFAYVLKYWKQKLNKKLVYLENSYTLNGYWKDTSTDSDPFVKHYMGCQLCSGINKSEFETCKNDFFASWNFANSKI